MRKGSLAAHSHPDWIRGGKRAHLLKNFLTALDAEQTLLICELDDTIDVIPIPDGYTIRFPRKDGPPGAHGSIAFKEKHWKTFLSDVLPEARSKLQATMGAWCKRGPQDLPPQKFKFEKQYEKGGKKTRIEVFKTRHVRFYGTTADVDGRPMFS